MEYMLNEISLEKKDTKMQAYGLMENFVYAAVNAEDLLNLSRLRIDESLGNNLYDIFLTNDYNIGSWVEDKNVNRDLKDKFLSIVSLSPLVEGELKRRFEEEDCFYNDIQGKGIKAALIYETFCINFLSNDCWNTATIPIRHDYIEEKGEDIKSVEKNIRCFGNKSHVESHLEWYTEFLKENIKKSSEIWDKKEELFPNLIFCNNIKKQVARIGRSTNLNNVINRLMTLSDVASNWQEGSFNYENINKSYSLTIHPESQQTMDNYGSLRKFSLPNGEKEIFSLHLIVGDLRIHFYPDNESQKIYIGYIGFHLRTWLY